MKNILEELYFGDVLGWEDHVTRTVEEEAVHERIRIEMQYFTDMMSDEDKECLIELENLFAYSHALEDKRTFIYAFRLGARIMCTVFMDEETEK